MNALEINGHTLVGVRGTPPHEYGNCFSVIADDDRVYQILNFVYENLEELLQRGLTFPIEIRNLSEYHAVIDDIRIGDRWYRKYFCTVCTPEELLPLPQKLVCERAYRLGSRKRKGSWIEYNNDIKPQFP
jgi:hypothetical protein